MGEDALIQAAKQGDMEAFNSLVLSYQNLVYNQAYRLLGEPEAAEDATQDAFILAYKHLHSYRGGSFKAWVMRIVTNVCYDELRRLKARRTMHLEPIDANDEEIESPSWLVDPGESPEAALERDELDRAIQNYLNELPMDMRAIVSLVDIQGFDYVEAADVLRIPLGTVKSRLARARLRLREALQKSGDLLPASFLMTV